MPRLRPSAIAGQVDFGRTPAQRTLPKLLRDKLRPGDICTLCYSGHREELLPDGKVNPVPTSCVLTAI
jgi:hypothetical protein